MARSKKPTRRQRHHGVLPAGFRWREGRPRWEPSPIRRGQGWKGLDLKDALGRFLLQGPAIEQAAAIADAVAAWAKGVAVPGEFIPIAPKGAAAAGLAPEGPRSIGCMLDAYLASPQFLKLADRSQEDYRAKLRRFTLIMADDEQDKVPELRTLDMDSLLPPTFGQTGDFALQIAHDDLCEVAGPSQAYAVISVVSAWLTWVVRKKRLWAANPAMSVDRDIPEGRIVLWDFDELQAMVETAEDMGLASIGDAVVLAIDLSWSPQDLRALTWRQISEDFHVRHRRLKTGNAGNPQLLAIGRRRIEEILKRQKPGASHVLISELTGKPWTGPYFRYNFAKVRDAVARKFPDVAGKQFRDLRDTSITFCIDAGFSPAEICTRSLHNPTRAAQIIQKHYGHIGQRVSDDAAQRLDAHHTRLGHTFEKRLALVAPPLAAE